MRAPIALRVSLAVLAVLSLPSFAAAQVPLDGFSLSGDIVAGGLYYLNDEPSPRKRGKYEEYRDLRDGLFLDRLDLHLARPDESYAVDFGGSKWGHDDQSFYLGTGRLGRWQFGFEWDQTPHIYSTTGRTLAEETARGVWTLPSTRDPLATWNSGRELGEIGQRWDTAHVFLAITPTPDLDLRADYTRIRKDGDRPFGIAFGSPGNNFLEILAPIEQTVQELRLRGTLARDNWQIQAGYTLSVFSNDQKALVADNPCFGPVPGPAGCGTDATSAGPVPATGQVSLDPSNMAHTWNLAGGVSLPMRSRINASVTYSLRLQNEDFLPHTVNSTILATDPNASLLVLPQKSLNGVVGTMLLNLSGTTRPLPPLTLSLHYRYWDLTDKKDEVVLAGHVVDDRGTVVTEARKAGRWSYSRQNADIDGRWRFGQPLALTLGTGWERWDRNEHWEVRTSDEFFAKAAVDATPWDWLLARLTYRPSFRRIDHYNTTAHLAHTVLDEPTATAVAQGQSFLLRKFDEADRDRQSVDLLLQFMPVETLTTSVNGGWRRDDYVSTPLGLQDATTWSAGFDTNWRPSERIALFAGYVHELIFQKQRSRSRPVVGTTTFDFPDFDWISDSTDTVDTVHAGTTITLIPRTLTWSTTASYAYALGRVETRNPIAPTSAGAGAGAITTAQAKRFPAFEDGLFRLDSTLHYRFWKVWTASISYAFESFDKHDWRTDTLNPFVPGVTSIWLGNDWRNYSAHSLIARIGYRF